MWSKMYEEQRYKNIALILSIFLIFDFIFLESIENGFWDLFVDAVAFITIICCYLWLKKTVLLLAMFFSFLAINYDFLYNPVVSNYGTFNTTFSLWLSNIAYLILLTGLVDSYFDDRFFSHKTNWKFTAIVGLIVIGSASIQVLVRLSIGT